MKESDWNDCLESNAAIKITPNKEKVKSLIETAEGRIIHGTKELHEKNANYVFEDYYASILELTHAIVIERGYNINNHLCLGFFFRDVLKREDLYRVFDDVRYKRNSLVYYGKRMDFETAKEAIEKSKQLMKELKAILKKE